MNSLYLLREKKDTFTLSAKFTENNILYILVKKRNITPFFIFITYISRVAMNVLNKNHIRTLPWSALSPDLNPIEHVWDEFTHNIL
jgi:hypothetical protein